MTLTIENILLIGSLLLFVSILVGTTSHKFGVPTLLLFLCVGMLAGSEGVGGIHFDDPRVAQFIGIVALNFILFSGGLDTNWDFVKPIVRQGLLLSSLGVLITASVLGLFVWAVTDFTIYESMLLGSIVSSTDAAAVFSILRAKSLALKSHLRPTLELESGSNDPMAYVLTILFLSLVVNQDQSLASLLPMLLAQMCLGAALGYAFGVLSKYAINRINLSAEGLYPVLVIALMFICFSATDAIGGNGFLAIYICAVYLGNQDIMHKKTIMKMYDAMAWLMQIIMFLTLGLLVFPSHIIPVLGIGILVSLFLILVARPVSVFISLIFFRMNLRRRLYISWVGLRGAAPIVFATYPLLAGIEKADMIFNIVFFVSVTSVVIQGTTLSMVAKRLNLAMPERMKPLSDTERYVSNMPKTDMREITVPADCAAVGVKIVDVLFPKEVIIVTIKRGEQYFTPKGSTVLESADVLYCLSDSSSSWDRVQSCLTRNEHDE